MITSSAFKHYSRKESTNQQNNCNFLIKSIEIVEKQLTCFDSFLHFFLKSSDFFEKIMTKMEVHAIIGMNMENIVERKRNVGREKLINRRI